MKLAGLNEVKGESERVDNVQTVWQLEKDTKWSELDKTSNVRYGTAGVKVEANLKVKAAESETAQQDTERMKVKANIARIANAVQCHN